MTSELLLQIYGSKDIKLIRGKQHIDIYEVTY